MRNKVIVPLNSALLSEALRNESFRPSENPFSMDCDVLRSVISNDGQRIFHISSKGVVSIRSSLTNSEIVSLRLNRSFTSDDPSCAAASLDALEKFMFLITETGFLHVLDLSSGASRRYFINGLTHMPCGIVPDIVESCEEFRVIINFTSGSPLAYSISSKSQFAENQHEITLSSLLHRINNCESSFRKLTEFHIICASDLLIPVLKETYVAEKAGLLENLVSLSSSDKGATSNSRKVFLFIARFESEESNKISKICIGLTDTSFSELLGLEAHIEPSSPIIRATFSPLFGATHFPQDSRYALPTGLISVQFATRVSVYCMEQSANCKFPARLPCGVGFPDEFSSIDGIPFGTQSAYTGVNAEFMKRLGTPCEESLSLLRELDACESGNSNFSPSPHGSQLGGSIAKSWSKNSVVRMRLRQAGIFGSLLPFANEEENARARAVRALQIAAEHSQAANAVVMKGVRVHGELCERSIAVDPCGKIRSHGVMRCGGSMFSMRGANSNKLRKGDDLNSLCNGTTSASGRATTKSTSRVGKSTSTCTAEEHRKKVANANREHLLHALEEEILVAAVDQIKTPSPVPFVNSASGYYANDFRDVRNVLDSAEDKDLLSLLDILSTRTKRTGSLGRIQSSRQLHQRLTNPGLTALVRLGDMKNHVLPSDKARRASTRVFIANKPELEGANVRFQRVFTESLSDDLEHHENGFYVSNVRICDTGTPGSVSVMFASRTSLFDNTITMRTVRVPVIISAESGPVRLEKCILSDIPCLETDSSSSESTSDSEENEEEFTSKAMKLKLETKQKNEHSTNVLARELSVDISFSRPCAAAWVTVTGLRVQLLSGSRNYSGMAWEGFLPFGFEVLVRNSWRSWASNPSCFDRNSDKNSLFPERQRISDSGDINYSPQTSSKKIEDSLKSITMKDNSQLNAEENDDSPPKRARVATLGSMGAQKLPFVELSSYSSRCISHFSGSNPVLNNSYNITKLDRFIQSQDGKLITRIEAEKPNFDGTNTALNGNCDQYSTVDQPEWADSCSDNLSSHCQKAADVLSSLVTTDESSILSELKQRLLDYSILSAGSSRQLVDAALSSASVVASQGVQMSPNSTNIRFAYLEDPRQNFKIFRPQSCDFSRDSSIQNAKMPMTYRVAEELVGSKTITFDSHGIPILNDIIPIIN